MTETNIDIIDRLVGASEGARLEPLRARRPVTKAQAQQSYFALFEPTSVADVSLSERLAVATFVALLHGDAVAAGHYGGLLADAKSGPAIAVAIDTAAKAATARGPYGHFPAGPLSTQAQAGPVYQVAVAEAAILGPRLAAALEHTHLLVFHPRDSSPEALQRLIDAGWSANGIVTLSQLVSFLAFQLRVVSGLRALVAA